MFNEGFKVSNKYNFDEHAMRTTMAGCNSSIDFSKPVAMNAGFTLIELMAILTMVAYPSYQDSMRRSRRSDAIAAALTIQAAEEQFRANCQFYAQTFVNAAAGNECKATAALSEVVASATSPEGYYAMTVTGASGNAYTITASPQNEQNDDTDCDPMTITFSTGSPNGVKAPGTCWP